MIKELSKHISEAKRKRKREADSDTEPAAKRVKTESGPVAATNVSDRNFSFFDKKAREETTDVLYL